VIHYQLPSLIGKDHHTTIRSVRSLLHVDLMKGGIVIYTGKSGRSGLLKHL
jgi:hypothetical protein